jgi:hypothetical protein
MFLFSFIFLLLHPNLSKKVIQMPDLTMLQGVNRRALSTLDQKLKGVGALVAGIMD